MRIAAWWLRKKYTDGKTKDQVHEDMVNCGNPLIKKLFDLINNSAQIDEVYQKSMMVDFSELLMWILYRDTAYRDPFVYVLKKALDMKDELMPMINKYYKEPKDWYVNAWHDSMEYTKQMRKDGKLGDIELSQCETYFVPDVQTKRMMKLNHIQDLEEEKKKRGW